MVDLDGMGRATRECVEEAHLHYMRAALWSTTDDDGTPLDSEHGIEDIAPETREQMLADVADFLSACWDDGLNLSALEPEQIGHDFWLTRNHHGAGFWDRGLGELGDDLTTHAHASGEFHLYVGDDGQIWGE